MEKIERVHTYLEQAILDAGTAIERRSIYAHMLAVSQFAAQLALIRGEDVALATVAGLLHDIHSYLTGESHDHARLGAETARGILTQLGCFTQSETERCCHAIAHHSEKKRPESLSMSC